MCRKAPWGPKERTPPPGYVMPRLPHRPLRLESILEKLCTHVGEGPRASQVWKKKPVNWAKVNKSPEELPYVNDLSTLRQFSSLERSPTPFLSGVHLCLAPTLTKQTDPFVCSPTCAVSNNKSHKDTILKNLTEFACTLLPRVLCFSNNFPYFSAASSEFILVKAGRTGD